MKAKSTLLGFVSCLELLREWEDMPLQQAMTFIYVCLNERQPFKFYADQLGVSQSTMSRNMAILGQFPVKKHQPLKLIDTEFDPEQRTRKLAVLTARGRRLRDTIIATLEGKQ